MSPSPHVIEALARSCQVREFRAQLKREVKSGNRTVASVLSSIPPEAAKMPIAELLGAQRGWGDNLVRGYLSRLAIGELSALQDLTPRQRRLIVEGLGSYRKPTAVPDQRWLAGRAAA